MQHVRQHHRLQTTKSLFVQAFSPDGSFVVTGGKKGAMFMYDVSQSCMHTAGPPQVCLQSAAALCIDMQIYWLDVFTEHIQDANPGSVSDTTLLRSCSFTMYCNILTKYAIERLCCHTNSLQ